MATQFELLLGSADPRWFASRSAENALRNRASARAGARYVCYRYAITLEVARRWEYQSCLQAPGSISPRWGTFRVTLRSDLSTRNCPTSEMPDELDRLALGDRDGGSLPHHHQQPLLLRSWRVFSRPPTPVYSNEWGIGGRSSVSLL